jgi:hypothetical protein
MESINKLPTLKPCCFIAIMARIYHVVCSSKLWWFAILWTMFNLQFLQLHLRSSVNKSPGITMEIIRTCMYKWRVKLVWESPFHLDIVWIWLQVCVFTHIIYLCNKFYKKCKHAWCMYGRWGHKWDVFEISKLAINFEMANSYSYISSHWEMSVKYHTQTCICLT